MKPYLLPLSDSQATLETVGGKGMSLAKMIGAGFPVPDGFHVTTEAYRQFIAANGLQPKILAALTDVDASLPTTLETASATISRSFAESKIPDEIATSIIEAYTALNNRQSAIEIRKSVAVRSSATAEDLPEASFAGQQETFLNIRGEEALLEAVKKCWASLWTARAIAYRIKNNIDQNTVALAVVVQEMVDAEAAGILFTANPINGHRDEMVINAAWGLGEAIVGGLVSPDTIVAAKATGKVKKYEVTEKAVITVRTEKGTREEKLEDARRKSKVLKEAEVVTLVEIARRIESFYGNPQDIEWCRANGNFYIVQSRPITALPEAPIEWIPPNPKGIYMRTSVVDLMPGPLSPLFITWAIPVLREQMEPLGVRLGMGLPVLQEDYYTSINSYAYMNAAFPPKAWWWIVTGMLPAYPRLLRKMVPIWRDELHPEYQAAITKYQEKDLGKMSAGEIWQDAQEILTAAMYYACGLLFATMGASAGSEGLLTRVYNRFAKREGDPEANALLMGWDNIPVRSEKSLYDLTMWIREDEKLAAYILDTPSHDLAGNLGKPDSVPAPLFAEFTSRFNRHLEKYGHLIFQMDFAEPLPRDHPEMLLETIKMFLRGQGTNPQERQHASEAKRIQTAETMRYRLKGIKRWAFVKALNWGQAMAEVREDALAEIGLGYPILRAMLRELGIRFAKAGVISQAEDIFWLEKEELETCVYNLEHGDQLKNLSERVEERRAFNKKVGQETPPPMMPMKKKYMGIDTSVWLAESERNRTSNILKGVPTSAGRVTAPARVLRGPEDFDKMRHGDVLVAGTTTPAWTPLFAMASAVVTDIGGPLSHGSIVAREYGIPAVMGTGVATKRILDGQVITVDGTKGEVMLETTRDGQIEQAAPPTTWKLPKGAYAAMRNNIVELMADPLSPLFATLGREAINNSLHRIMNDSFAMRGIMPAEIIIMVNHYAFNNGSISPKAMARVTLGAGKIMKRMFTGAVERWTVAGRPRYFQTVEEWKLKNWRSFSSSELVDGARQLTESAIDAYAALVSGVIPAAWITEAIFTTIYNKLIKRRDDPSAPTYLLGYDSLPIRADKSLFSLAEWAKQDPALTQCLERTSTAQLIALCESGVVPGSVAPALWQEWHTRVHQHLHQYGHMLYDLDFVHPVPADDPAPVLDALKLYLSGQGTNPYTRQHAYADRREQAVLTMQKRLKGLRLKWFNQYLASAQKYAPLREDGLAEIGLAYPLIRQMLGELGDRFVQHKVISVAEDIFWLTKAELLSTAARLDEGQSAESLAENIPQRKAEHRAAQRVTPPMALPQMKVFGFDLMSLKDKRGRRNRGDVIKGVAASPGVASGVARVLHGPEDFGQMKPGDVLVAPITTPAWTPLFALASAVVTDVGGPLSHGSIVAREYGIPAVLGTGVASRRIQSGALIEVNGTEGNVHIKSHGTSTDGTPLEWPLPVPKAVLARGSFAEFVPEPVSPLFATLAVPIARKSTQDLMAEFGVTGENSYLFEVLNHYVYVGFVFTPKLMWQMIKASFLLLGPIMRTARQRAVTARAKFLEVVQKWQARELAALTPTELLAGVRELFTETALYYNMAQSGTIPTSMISETTFGAVYKLLVKRKSDPKAETFVFGSENLAIRSEKALFDLTMWAKDQPELADYLTHTSSDAIRAALQTKPQSDPVLQEFATRFDSYLHEYGHAIYDLDFAKPTPGEDPTPLLETVKVYLSGKNNPYERQHAALTSREQAAEAIAKRLDPLRRRWFLKLLKSAQDTAHLREDSIADLGLGHPQIRRILREFGQRLAAQGAIACADDIYWLEAQEVDALATLLEKGEALKNLAVEVESRRAKWQAMRHIIPPTTLPKVSWLSKFYPSNEPTSKKLKGFAASAGKVTARACVMLGPEDFSKMQSGDVIVAGITTPAWTPLFARASAIVTDIGGALSHSSIVAREYGIPAVLATGVGTRRIQSGQIITVDGGKGEVILETAKEEAPPPLEWNLPNPHTVAARMSFVEFVPDAVSPLFATLAVPIASQATSKLMLEVMGWGEQGYYFDVVNNYVYGCLDTRQIFKYFLIGIAASSKILQYGKTQKEEAPLRSRSIAAKWRAMDLSVLPAMDLASGVRELFSAAAYYFTMAQAGPIPLSTMGEASFRMFYNTLVKRKSDPPAATFLLGLENLPLHAETSLFDLAQWIQGQPDLADYIQRTPSHSIWDALQTDPVPDPLSDGFSTRFASHLDAFGHAIYDLDFTKSVPADDPTPLLDTLKVYLAGQGHDPNVRIQSQVEQRLQAEQSIVKRLDPLRRRWFQKLLKNAQEAAPERENAIADLGLTYPQIKRILRELGLRLTKGVAVACPEDIYWLEATEMDELATSLDKHEPLKDFSGNVTTRKAGWQRTFNVTPPAVLATNKWLSKLVTPKKAKTRNSLKGYGASAGTVTAPARILRSSEDFSHMHPGEVLVAVTTTPAWTPLFAMASAIVTDIGGPLSHSSIVAREYGIPAVLATGIGTRRIHDGQIITVDGSAGMVTLGPK